MTKVIKMKMKIKIPYCILIFLIFISLFSLIKAKRTKQPSNYGRCKANEYKCRNEQCIKKSLFCNGQNDCGDNSDEQYCSSSCPTHYSFYRCQDYSKCIPLVWKCDGDNDCRDKSDERNCLDDVEQISGSVMAREKALRWIVNQRQNVFTNKRWGEHAPRIAIALHLANTNMLNNLNSIKSEIAYEVENRILLNILRDQISPVSMGEIAIYIHALLVTCINPQDFHGINLVSQLRQRVNDQTNYTNPLVLLSLCNANDEMNAKDIEKLTNIFKYEQQPSSWTSTKALALMALTCISERQKQPYVSSALINNLSSNLKLKQQTNGSFENIYTTALVMQAIFASGTEDNYWDMDEAVKFLVKSQDTDGSYDTFLNTYYTLPVLHYKSLLNISLSHCENDPSKYANDALFDLSQKVLGKISVKYSVSFGNPPYLVRSLVIRVAENDSFFDIMKLAESLDNKYSFKHTFINKKPHIYYLSGFQEDPESEHFWFLHKANGTGFPYEAISSSPVDVYPKDEEEYIMWYRSRE